jgi:hypothetical protein
MSTVKRLALLLSSMAFALILAGCGGGDKGSSADPPADFRVQGGDGSVVVTWTAEPETEYWIFFGVGPDITTTNWAVRGGVAITNAQSPRIITGLTNGTTYSFTINARKNKGPGGQGAPTQAVVPRLAGDTWAPGPPLGTQDLRSVAAGTLANGFDVVAVGNGGVIFSNISTGAFAERTNPAAGTNLNAVTYGLAGFMAAGDNGVILQSLDAITWAQRTSGTTARLNGGASSATATYVFVGAGGAVVTSGDGGGTWTTPGLSLTEDLHAVTWGANRFVAVGGGGVVITGTSGADWGRVAEGVTTATLRGAAYGQLITSGSTMPVNVYVAVGDGGAVLRSEDGQVWTLLPSFTTQNLRGATYGGRFVAVGEDGALFTSVDGLTWEPRTSGTGADLDSVARTITGYTAVGEAGTNVSTF